MSLTARLLAAGFEAVNLKAGNVKPGDNIVNRNDLFGTLLEITKQGDYVVQFDIERKFFVGILSGLEIGAVAFVPDTHAVQFETVYPDDAMRAGIRIGFF